MPRVIGIDPSLTGLGLAIIDTAPAGGIHSYQLGVFKSKKTGDTWLDVQKRIDQIIKAVRPTLQSFPSLVVMESPAFSSTSGASHDRSWLWGRIYDEAVAAGVPVVTFVPQQIKIYATGKGTVDKDEVIAASVRRWPNIEGLSNNNAADAWNLATMGTRMLDHPVEPTELAKVYLRALDKVRH